MKAISIFKFVIVLTVVTMSSGFLWSKIKYSEMAKHPICYLDQRDGETYFLSTGSIEQILDQYLNLFGQNSIEPFSKDDMSSITFKDGTETLTLNFEEVELVDGKCSNVTSINESSNELKPKSNFNEFENTISHIASFHNNVGGVVLGEIYNQHAAISGFYLGMDKTAACNNLQRLMDPIANDFNNWIVGYLKNDVAVNALTDNSKLLLNQFSNQANECGYRTTVKIALNNVEVGSYLNFKNDKLTELFLDRFFVEKIYDVSHLSADEFADAMINSVPWLGNGLEGEVGGWYYSSNYGWKFSLSSESKSITIKDTRIKSFDTGMNSSSNTATAPNQFEKHVKLFGYAESDWGCFIDVLIDGERVEVEGCPEDRSILSEKTGQNVELEYRIGMVEGFRTYYFVDIQ